MKYFIHILGLNVFNSSSSVLKCNYMKKKMLFTDNTAEFLLAFLMVHFLDEIKSFAFPSMEDFFRFHPPNNAPRRQCNSQCWMILLFKIIYKYYNLSIHIKNWRLCTFWKQLITLIKLRCLSVILCGVVIEPPFVA